MLGYFQTEQGFAVVPERVQALEECRLVGRARRARVEEREEAGCYFALEETQVCRGNYGPLYGVRVLDCELCRFGVAFEDGLVGWWVGWCSGLNVGWRCSVTARCRARGFLLCWDELDTVRSCALYGRY